MTSKINMTENDTAYLNRFNKYVEGFIIGKGEEHTHTIFGNYCRSLNIPDSELDIFYNMYKKASQLAEFNFTEKQKTTGPLIIDIDFKFNHEHGERQYDDECIELLSQNIIKLTKKYFKINNDDINVIVSEKESPCFKEKTNEYKDGIHLTVPLPFDVDMRYYIREELINNAENEGWFDNIPFTNTLDDVFDKAVVMRNGWMMYGSKKKDGKMYDVSCVYDGHGNKKDSSIYDHGEKVILGSVRQFEDCDKLLFKTNYDTPEFIQLIDSTINKNKRKQNKQTKEVKPKRQIENENYNDIVDLIDVKYLNDFDTWNRIVWAMKHEGYTEEKTRAISMKSPEYTDNGFNTSYNSSPVNITLSQGTLNYYAKLSNPDEYYKIKANGLIVKDSSDHTLANILLENLSDDFVFMNKQIHMYDYNMRTKKNEWFLDVCESSKNKCQEHLIDFMMNIKTEDDDEKKILKESIKKIKGLQPMKNIHESFKIMLSKRHDDVEFDIGLPNILCFNNIAFNVLTGEKYELKKDDYSTYTTGYNYKKSTVEQLLNMDKILKDIFPDKKIRDCWLSVALSACTGIRPEHIFICLGNGRNGKGLINELLEHMLGEDYSYKGDSTNLTQKRKDGSSANADMSNCNKKRMLIYSELEHGSSLCMGLIKEMTGGGKISARELFKQKIKCKMNGTLMLECNDAPAIDCKIDVSVTERIVLIPFNTTFTNDKKLLESDETAYKPLNPKFKTEEFKDEYANVLFDYLMMHAPKNIYIPDVVKNESLKYLEGNNNVFQWFEESYEEEAGSHVMLKDLFEEFKTSEQYKNLNKNEKVKFLFKTFKDKIKGSPLVKHFCDAKKINGKTQKNVLLNYASINNDVIIG